MRLLIWCWVHTGYNANTGKTAGSASWPGWVPASTLLPKVDMPPRSKGGHRGAFAHGGLVHSQVGLQGLLALCRCHLAQPWPTSNKQLAEWLTVEVAKFTPARVAYHYML